MYLRHVSRANLSIHEQVVPSFKPRVFQPTRAGVDCGRKPQSTPNHKEQGEYWDMASLKFTEIIKERPGERGGRRANHQNFPDLEIVP